MVTICTYSAVRNYCNTIYRMVPSHAEKDKLLVCLKHEQQKENCDAMGTTYTAAQCQLSLCTTKACPTLN